MGEEEGERAADGGHEDADEDEQSPLGGAEHGVEDEEDDDAGDGNDDGHALVGALLAFVFAGPLEVVADGEFDVVVDLLDGFFDGGAEVAVFDRVLDGDVALSLLAVDFFGAVVEGGLGELGEGDPFAGG